MNDPTNDPSWANRAEKDKHWKAAVDGMRESAKPKPKLPLEPDRSPVLIWIGITSILVWLIWLLKRILG